MAKNGYIVDTKSNFNKSDFGLSCIHQPLLAINLMPLDQSQKQLLAKAQAIIVTSKNALHVFPIQGVSGDVQVLCVGETTANAIEKLGYQNIQAFATVSVLREWLEQMSDNGAGIFYLRGRDVRCELKSDFLELQECIVYKADPVSVFSDVFLEALKNDRIAAITFYSVRAVHAFEGLIKKTPYESNLGKIKALSISQPVLDCVRQFEWLSLECARTPDRGGMSDLIRSV